MDRAALEQHADHIAEQGYTVLEGVISPEHRKFNCPLSAVSRGIARRVRGNGRLLKDRSAVGGRCFARNGASPFPGRSV